MSQGGYAIVDVDDEPGDISGHGEGLQFKSFLASDAGSNQPSTSSGDRQEDQHVPYSPFNIAYYQTYFDVDTTTVLRRVGLSMIPRGGFAVDVCEGSIDLYGPFWTLTTLILILYTTSTLTASISRYLSDPDQHMTTNLPLLSTALSTVYFYGLVVPVLLWAVVKWLGVGDWSVVEALGTYGYAMSVFIPIGLACLIPVGLLRWVFVGGGTLSSGWFLTQNIYPVLANADNKMGRLLIIGVIGLHAVMALTMKVMFFSYAVAGVQVGPDPINSPLEDT